MKNHKPHILAFLIACFLFLTPKVHAQEDYFGMKYRIGRLTENKYNPDWRKKITRSLATEQYDIEDYFPKKDSDKQVFSKVTEYSYSATDSTMNNRWIIHKEIHGYNKVGELEWKTETDSEGHVQSAKHATFDNQYNKVFEVDSERNNDDELELWRRTYLTWSPDGKLLKDSISHRTQSWENKPQFVSDVWYYSYDDAGNITRELEIDYRDTTIRKFKDDPRSRTSMIELYKHGKWDTISFCRYNSRGYAIFTFGNGGYEYPSFERDSVRYYLTYDELNRCTQVEEFNGKELAGLMNADYQPDSSYTETIHQFGIKSEGENCSYTINSVFSYNRFGLLTKSVIGNEGEAVTTTIVHYYRMDGRHVLADSSVKTQVGDLVSETEKRVVRKKYNARGKCTERVVKAPYSGSSKETYTSDDMDNMLEDDDYNNCFDGPFERNIRTYYAGTHTMKTHFKIYATERKYWYYGPDGRTLSELSIEPNSTTRKIEQTVYEYIK